MMRILPDIPQEAGIIVVESLTITYETRSRKNQLKISEETAPDLERLVREMREINSQSLILFQINHSGKVSGADFSKVVSIYPTGDPNIHLLTEEEIEAIGEMFVKAAAIGWSRWDRFQTLPRIFRRRDVEACQHPGRAFGWKL